MIALACAGHVLIDLPLFGAPVLLLGGGVWFTTRAERRRASDGGLAQSADRLLVADELQR
jgi:hypothetical protein